MTFDEYLRRHIAHISTVREAQHLTPGEECQARLAWDAAIKAACAWRSMESAPTEIGTRIVYYDGSGVGIAERHHMNNGDIWWIDTEFLQQVFPLRWLPLPEPPEAK